MAVPQRQGGRKGLAERPPCGRGKRKPRRWGMRKKRKARQPENLREGASAYGAPCRFAGSARHGGAFAPPCFSCRSGTEPPVSRTGPPELPPDSGGAGISARVLCPDGRNRLAYPLFREYYRETAREAIRERWGAAHSKTYCREGHARGALILLKKPVTAMSQGRPCARGANPATGCRARRRRRAGSGSSALPRPAWRPGWRRSRRRDRAGA